MLWSLSEPEDIPKVWNPVPCAKSEPVSYWIFACPAVSDSSCPPLKTLEVIVSLKPLSPTAFPWNWKSAPSVAGWISINLKIYVL